MPLDLTFTLDVEDHQPAGVTDLRVAPMTERVLDFLDEQQIRATVFVVGKLVHEHPGLVKEIDARGHELGLHSWDHEPLPQVGRSAFVASTRRGKGDIEDLTGKAVLGYRAPTFSLVPDCVWVTEELTEAGFHYSSSVLPAHSPLY
jgi:peptidoglycan/xylan/chitin deacetylase (PgdA/CDA1 family)